MRRKLDPPDVAVAEVAARQHGVISVRQLRDCGVGEGGVGRRVRGGRLHRVHRGVYAVGHAALSGEGEWMAAVLAMGEGATLSHRSAAALWGLLRREDGPIEVSVASRGGRAQRDGIRVHRPRSLARAGSFPAVTLRSNIPVTSVPRTLADLRGVVSPRLHRRAVRQAELAGFALGPSVSGDGTRSDLETDFLAFCRSHRLPLPEVDVQLGRWKVDFLWRRARLVVETDSYDYHRGSVSFEDDHARDLDLRRRGFAVRRYTGAQIRNHPALVVADLREILSRTDRSGGSSAS